MKIQKKDAVGEVSKMAGGKLTLLVACYKNMAKMNKFQSSYATKIKFGVSHNNIKFL